ncbi:MAG: hypothetical protein V4580_15900 [Bacteroidota bacterium]
MLLESKGIQLNVGFIPSFDLNEGEIVVLYLYGGGHYYPTKRELIKVLTGEIDNASLQRTNTLKLVEIFFESKLRRLFSPISVDEYIKKNSNPDNSIAEEFYNFPHSNYDMLEVGKKTRVNSLEGTSKKALTLYSALSHSKYIIFDLDGISRKGSRQIYEIIKQKAREGGAAILIDWSEEFKYDCSKFITIQLTT